MTAVQPTVAVVGAGITGLRAARLLTAAGADVEVYEGGSRIGGQIRTVEIAGLSVDVGAEAMHLGAGGAAALLADLGLTDDMITARPGASWLATPRGLRRLPAGVGPAGPTRLRPVVSSRVMSVPGLARAGLEPLMARARGGALLTPGHDRSVAEFVAGRFGEEVVDRFVDPLLGSLHSGDVRRLSLRACAPSLVPAASEGRSLIARRPRRPGAPRRPAPTMSFVSWREGLTRVVDALAAGLSIHTRTPVESVTRTPDGRFRLELDAGPEAATTREVDAVVLAVPSHVASRLLTGVAAQAGRIVAETERAGVATVVFAYPRHVVAALPAFRGTGVLIPSSTGSLLKAATFLSTKWPHLDDPDTYVVRLSAGRAGDERLAGLDDDALVTQIRRDLHRFIGLDVAPRHQYISRWPAAMPQLTVGHLDRVAAARADLPGGIALAGSSYDGVGIAACLTSAQRAAEAVLAHLGLPREEASPA